MNYDPNIHTICTHEREVVLDNPNVHNIVEETWLALPERFPGVALDEFVVMPNHVHGIVIIRDAAGAKLGKLIRAFKSISAVQANQLLGRSDRPFWQRDYYERVIRSETELLAVRQYIRDNPLGWDVDPDNPEVVAQSRRR